MLGNLSNVLIRDGDILTPIINLNKLSSIKQISKNSLHFSVQAGTPISRFAIFFTKKIYLVFKDWLEYQEILVVVFI